MRNIHSKTLTAAAAALTVMAGAATAAPVELGGYFRSGAGSSTEGGNIVCYRLPGAVVWFRLGNECDTYVALTFKSKLGEVDGTTFRAQFTTAQGTQGIGNWEQSTPALREAFVEAQDLGAAMKMPALNGSSLWIGKRYYKNPDIHMLDYTFWEPAQGPGFGLDNVDVGIGKFSYAQIRIGDFTGYGSPGIGGFSPDLIDGGSAQVTVHDFRIQGIKTNPGGSLTAGIDLVQENNQDVPSASSGGNGWALTVTHEQSNLFGLGGGNTLGFQYAKGAAFLKGFGFGTFDPDGHKEWLLFDHWYVAPKGSPFSATSTFGYRHYKDSAGTAKEFWIGTRPVWDLNNIWSLFGEVGYQQVKPEGADTRKLVKATVGTAFSMGPGVWARPSLRFYVTYAKWNTPAGNVACSGRDCGRSVPAFDDKTKGVSYGAQVEAWF